ncbi:MAG TPA: response regulator transcription factor [Chloroflexota bacterium]
MSILVAEDDPIVARMLVDFLEFRGYRVHCVSTAGEAEACLAAVGPELILLDLKLPDANGLVLCAELKARCDAPVIICSATKRKEDAILGLKLGADDFISKPFNPGELQARIEAALRRGRVARSTEGACEDGSLEIGGLVVDRRRCCAALDGRALPLTPTEYRLLAELASRPGEVIAREDLAQTVWGYHDYGVGRSLDVHVRRLRAKLRAGMVGGPTIVTARGFGYRLAPESAGAPAAGPASRSGRA